MKTLGEVKVGDEFYLIYYSTEGNCLLNVRKYTVSIINEIQIGKIIKWIDNAGNIRGTTISKEKYNDVMDNAFYECKICLDKEFVLKFIEDDKNDQIEKYKKMLKLLSDD